MKRKPKKKTARRGDRLSEIESILDEMVRRLGRIEIELQRKQGAWSKGHVFCWVPSETQQ